LNQGGLKEHRNKRLQRYYNVCIGIIQIIATRHKDEAKVRCNSVKKKQQPETLAFEILREQRNKLRISLAANAILFIAIILTIVFR